MFFSENELESKSKGKSSEGSVTFPTIRSNSEELVWGIFNLSTLDLTNALWSRIMRSPFWKTLFSFSANITQQMPTCVSYVLSCRAPIERLFGLEILLKPKRRGCSERVGDQIEATPTVDSGRLNSRNIEHICWGDVLYLLHAPANYLHLSMN